MVVLTVCNDGFQFNLAIPITFLVCCIFLLIIPLYAAPTDTGMGLAIVCSGVPVYLIGVAWKGKPKIFVQYVGKWISLLV